MSFRPWLIVLMLTTTACAAPATAVVTPHEEASSRVNLAVQQSGQEAENPETLVVEARYNPAACDAPPWELRLRGAWVRTTLRAGREMTSEASFLLTEEDIIAGSMVSLRVAPTTRTEPGADGLRFRVLELVSIVDTSHE